MQEHRLPNVIYQGLNQDVAKLIEMTSIVSVTVIETKLKNISVRNFFVEKFRKTSKSTKLIEKIRNFVIIPKFRQNIRNISVHFEKFRNFDIIFEIFRSISKKFQNFDVIFRSISKIFLTNLKYFGQFGYHLVQLVANLPN